MGDSNGDWGQLVAYDDEQAALWDSFSRLPEPGDNPALDAFVDRKNITINSLVRLGAKLSGPDVIAYAFPGGIKFRNVVTDERHNYFGSEFRALKIVQQTATPAAAVIVAEGETDAARLTELSNLDVAVLPAGAKRITDDFIQQLAGYTTVYVALDDDEAGNEGAAILLAALPQAARITPPGNDWCEAPIGHELELPEVAPRPEAQILVAAGDLLDLDPPPMISWYEHDVLPVGGQLILHGWAKSFKSFIALDLLAALAQGQDWACFEPIEEPCRVAVMQYEIPWGYYQQRVRSLHDAAREPELFNANFLTFTPLRRPTLTAGDKKAEDYVLKELVRSEIQVFLLDPIRRATGLADMNSEAEVRKILRFFERVQDEGITVVTTHHDNKQGARYGGGNPLDMTGTGAFSGDADTIVSVSVPKGVQAREPKRNLDFTLRNSPAITPRGMEMREDGTIVYSPAPLGDGFDDAGPSI